jgi:hypothetical protein
MSSSEQQLIRMALQIAANCGARGDTALAASKTADHMRRFWTPAMIDQLQQAASRSPDLDPMLEAILAAVSEAPA